MKGCVKLLVGGVSLLSVLCMTGISCWASEAGGACGDGGASTEQVVTGHWDDPWDQTTPYRKNDTVIHKGTAFVAVQDNFMEEPGKTPGYWRCVPASAPLPPVRDAIGSPSSKGDGPHTACGAAPLRG
jgi:hypothetical protein